MDGDVCECVLTMHICVSPRQKEKGWIESLDRRIEVRPMAEPATLWPWEGSLLLSTWVLSTWALSWNRD